MNLRLKCQLLLNALKKWARHDRIQVVSSDDQTKCYVIEWLKNSRAWLIYRSNIEQIAPALFAIATITRLEVFGDISKDAEDALKPFGAVIHKHLSGFIREQY